MKNVNNKKVFLQLLLYERLLNLYSTYLNLTQSASLFFRCQHSVKIIFLLNLYSQLHNSSFSVLICFLCVLQTYELRYCCLQRHHVHYAYCTLFNFTFIQCAYLVYSYFAFPCLSFLLLAQVSSVFILLSSCNCEYIKSATETSIILNIMLCIFLGFYKLWVTCVLCIAPHLHSASKWSFS